MKLKSILCLILSFAMICISVSSIAASNVNEVNSGNIKVARFENSSQIKNKATNSDIVLDCEVSFSLSHEGLQIQGVVEDTSFSAAGALVTKNATNSNLSYTAMDMNNNYDILYMCLDKRIEDVTFLDGFLDNISAYSNVIKLYVQDKSNNDYIMIEIYIEYDFVGNYIANNVVAHDEGVYSEMFSWFTNHIEAENETEQVSTYTVRQRTYKREYSTNGRTYSYNLTVAFTADINNLSKNGTSTSSAYIEVLTSNIVDADGEEYAAVQYELRLTNVNIVFITIPNTIVTEQRLIGEGVGTLNDTLTFEFRKDTFSAAQSAIVDATHKTYTTSYTFNGIDETTSTSGIRLTSSGYNNINTRTNYKILREVGDKYGFDVTVQDKVGVATSGKAIVKFQFSVVCPQVSENDINTSTSLNITQTVS